MTLSFMEMVFHQKLPASHPSEESMGDYKNMAMKSNMWHNI